MRRDATNASLEATLSFLALNNINKEYCKEC